MWMKRNPRLQRERPAAMIGIEIRRIRRLPTRSMSTSARQVKTKLVSATDSAVIVGLAKCSNVNIVAEKYIREF